MTPTFGRPRGGSPAPAGTVAPVLAFRGPLDDHARQAQPEFIEEGAWVYEVSPDLRREIEALSWKLTKLLCLRRFMGGFLSRLLDDLLADAEKGTTL